MKHKTWLLSPLALIPAGTLPAAAAPPHRPPHPTVPAISSMPTWAGFYVGANLGGISARSGLSSFDPLPGSGLGYCFGGANPFFANPCNSVGAQTATGILGGGQIGYNFESADKWVYGAELDFDFSGARQQTSALNNPNAFLGTWTAKTGIDDFGTARLRLGYDFNNIMPFVTGGLAYANVLDTFQGGSGGAGGYTWSGTGWRAGYTVGGGVEVLLTRNISVKGEALYYNLGSENHVSVQPFSGSSFGVTDRMTGALGRIGINYLFH